uniref:uncharacterized protein LOC125906439 n=1 Tax=Anopheles coluzzii TaxID=1518534 RepID=UPI0020FFE00D|nr:uncharacterized protein LOC125906439 [Anopheles coluzzii]XP_049467071.1 uncharacterized protein LOC125908390 [Anopheles coluzzii]
MMQHSPDLQRASLALPLVPEAAEMRPADVNDAAAAAPTMEPTTERQVDTCHAIRLNVPEMDTNNLPSFFCALEHWFAASGITAKMDNRRFHIAMAQIPLRLFSELQPLLGNVPATDRYDFVKKTILAHYSESQRRRLHRLLYATELGDRKPSQLLAEMRRAAGDTIIESLLVDLWIGKLPPHVQSAVIAAQGATADKTAVADAIMDCISPLATTSACNTMAEVRTTTDFEAQMTRKVDDLSRQLNEFMRQCRQSDRFRTHPRSQPPTPSRRVTDATDGQCYYHRRFGRTARSCRQPCSYPAPVSPSSGQPPSSA